MLRVEIVAVDRIVQILDPVDLDGVGDVPYIVQKNVLVALDDAVVLGVVQVLGDPLGGYQGLRVRVALLQDIAFGLCQLLPPLPNSARCLLQAKCHPAKFDA